ncbi:TPA: hypothetical protein ACWMJU_006089 [Pseudomonas aeruginosa]|uniref:Uncharacterized protein n=1 Tax=Pseudomonas moraviensis R28-S TaxID=1395516 RepID=V8R5K7_9PSED|nr:hypothetical protein [Pseudomonas moraviensis]ETF06855.1 hypothetical protein PMO01_18575 [Pseudomonas moraviensis R28-S]
MNTLKDLLGSTIKMLIIFGISFAIALVVPKYFFAVPLVLGFLYWVFEDRVNEFLFDEETFEMSLVAFIAAPVAAIAAAFSFNYTLGIWALAFTLYKTHAFRHLHRAIGSGFKALFGSVVSSISKH